MWMFLVSFRRQKWFILLYRYFEQVNNTIKKELAIFSIPSAKSSFSAAQTGTKVAIFLPKIQNISEIKGQTYDLFSPKN